MAAPDLLARACSQLEAVLLRQFLTEAGIGRSPVLLRDPASEGDDGGSSGASQADAMQSIFVDAMAQAMAGADRLGMGRALESSLRGTIQ
jgi:hypothetical protein